MSIIIFCSGIGVLGKKGIFYSAGYLYIQMTTRRNPLKDFKTNSIKYMEEIMKNTTCKKKNSFLATVLGLSILLSTQIALAADDPSIKGDLRQAVMDSMRTYIENRMVNDTFYMYDASHGKLLKLKFDKLHEGIVKKGGFYVSCADFFDSNGKKIDLDFLVVEDGKQLKTIQAVVHSVDGKKRKYHLEG